jgi:signal transduction histidine kinase
MAGLLFDTTSTEEQREFASTIRRSGDHLLTVINDILDFSPLESGKFPIAQIPYGVASIVEEAADIVAGMQAEQLPLTER